MFMDWRKWVGLQIESYIIVGIAIAISIYFEIHYLIVAVIFGIAIFGIVFLTDPAMRKKEKDLLEKVSKRKYLP